MVSSLVPRTALSPALDPLWERWQEAGFPLSTHERLRVEVLLQRVDTLGESVDRARLCGLLCPLVTRTPEAQIRFRRIFADVFRDEPRILDLPLPLAEQGSTTPEQGSTTPEQGSTAPAQGGTAPAQGSTAPAQGGSETEQRSTAPEQGNTAPEQGNTAPEQGNTAPEQGSTAPEQGSTAPEQGNTTPEQESNEPEQGNTTPEQKSNEPEQESTTSEQGSTAPEQGSNEPDETQATIKGPYHLSLRLPEAEEEFSFAEPPSSKLPLRVRRTDLVTLQTQGHTIDIPKSLEESLRMGGMPRFLLGTRRYRRSLVALVEFGSKHDHRTPYHLALLRRLDGLGADIRVYFLEQGGTRCRALVRRERGFLLTSGTEALPLTKALRDINRATTTLVYLGTKDALRPQRGEPSPLAQTLRENWQAAHVLASNIRWSTLEAVLSTHRSVCHAPLTDYPTTLWQTQPSFWSAERAAEAVDALESLLPHPAFVWLCACMALPVIRWDLTVDFGNVLDKVAPSEGPFVTEENLLSLLPLPWFQGQGQEVLTPVPKPLRAELLRRLPERFHMPVHQHAQEILRACVPTNQTVSWATAQLWVEETIQAARLQDQMTFQSLILKLVQYELRGWAEEQPELAVVLPGTVKIRIAAEQALQKGYPALADYLRNLVMVPSGNFSMGSAASQWEDERPVHTVTLSQFYMGRTPVTVALWREYCIATNRMMPPEPTFNQGWKILDHPIVNVSWDDVVGTARKAGFCTWSSLVSGITLQLPTEAQWEYACRGDKNNEYPWGNTWEPSQCINETNSPGIVNPKNHINRSWCGVLDMSGNVWEWCHDWFGEYNKIPQYNPAGPPTGSFRVLKGGSFVKNSPKNIFRGAHRYNLVPQNAMPNIGFRLSATP